MVIEDGVPGHIIETGVWRGGASFMAAKTVELLGEDSTRRVYLADSFQGIPPAPTDREYHWEDQNANTITILNENSPKRVISDAATFGLNMNHLRWVVGYFNETMPKLVADEPDVRFSVIRLDGDTYFSTIDAIRVLYPRLNPGGFIIIDDFTDWTGCMNAIRHYRKKHDIHEPIVMVPHQEGESVRGVYWRKGPLKEGMSQCSAPRDASSLRPKGSYNPASLVDMPEGGPPNIGVGLIKIWNVPGIKMCT
jgi:O-methyltransferase